MIAHWNDTDRAYPPDATLHRLFEAQVQRTPRATAVVYENDCLSYRELSERANQVARGLREWGVGPEVLVGICMVRSWHLVVALLGVLKAGAAYVPLDPDSPRDRLLQMVDDAGRPVILTQQAVLESHADLFAKAQQALALRRIVRLDADWEEVFARRPTDNLNDTANSTNLAYVIYTSGTTGKPKGVMNTHRGICNRVLWMQDEYQIGGRDAVLQKTPTSFDVSVWEFFWPLITGARLVMARPAGHLDSNYLCDLIHDEQISVMHFVPSMLRIFLQEPELRRCRSLRHVICSGEALSVDLQNRFFEQLQARLHNLYGPTEAAIDVTSWECRRDDPHESVPIGRPVANTQIHILDDQLQPVAVGDIGELHIGGVQVARGYLNQPELTAEKFIADPFRDDPAARLYKTGDLARYWPDGNIEFLGRSDHQVKVRGFRIELDEIESVLAAHKAVHHAVVIAHDYGPDDRRLVAYIAREEDQPQYGRDCLVDALRQWVHDKLPEFMTPSVFVTVDEMPLTPSGKLDRQALPAPPHSRPTLTQHFVPPRTALERHLTAMWRDILQLQEIGVHDPFFELGGDSLRAALFVNELQQVLHEFIYVVTIFQAPSVAQYAAFLQRDYPAAVARWLDRDQPPRPAPVGHEVARYGDRPMNEHMASRLQAAVPCLSALPQQIRDPGPKNPSMVFILAPPRSGTTLLRVMLAGHPRLFAAAELQLLSFHTLRQRRNAFAGRFSAWLDGTLRAIMELRQCTAEEAKQLMASYEQRNDTTKDFYRQLQEWAGERMLLDKSPSYALDPAALQKAESDFEDPRYVHLVRHPYAMVRSFERQHMDQVLYLGDHDFTTRELGELVWTLSHRNILDFLAHIPPRRQVRIGFEQLTQHPRRVMTGLCTSLDLEFDPGVIQPYKNQVHKMVDGIHAESTPMGDPNFLRHQQIIPEVADSWKQVVDDDFLGQLTWDIAHRLGYARPGPAMSDSQEHWANKRATARARRARQQQRRQRRGRQRDETDNP